MNITELENFQLAKAIDFNTDLNPQIFANDKMRPLVRNKLMEIADHFREFLGVQDIALVDIEISGSNAAYSYTPHSDVDLHLIVDFSKLPNDEVYRELFNAKKYQYNDSHDIKIKGYDVELYVQDSAQQHHSLGSYSVMNDTWNRIPTKQRANLNDTATLLKYEKLKDLSIRALASDNADYLNDVLDLVKKYRQAGLDKHGEFGPENLAFKMLRTDGYFEKLWAKKRSHTDRNLSLETKVEEPDTLAQELIAEFNAETTMHETADRLVTSEAAYAGNLGFMEVMQFYKEASKEMVDLLNRLVAADKNKEAWQLIQKITGTTLKGQQFNEMGRIVKGVNTTQDVDVDEIKVQAKKMGFDVTIGGVPEIPKNGVPKLFEGIEQLDELKMAPGSLQKEVNKILKSAAPVLGLEFEVCMRVDEDIIPPVTEHTSLDDLKDAFDNSEDDEVYDEISNAHLDWLIDKKEPGWVDNQVQEACNTPSFNDYEKIEFMQDFTPSGEADEFIAEITGDEDKIELTDDIARETISVAQAAYKEHGLAVDWPVTDDTNPYLKLYYDIFIEDSADAETMLRDIFQQDFWDSEVPGDTDYSLGSWFLESQIASFREVKNEFNELYSDTITQGGDYTTGGFDYESAQNLAYSLEGELGYEVQVLEEDEEPDYTVWNITPDSSIKPDGDDDGGFEIVMPATPYEKAIDDISEMFDFLTQHNGYTNESTGLHINVSLKNVDHSQLDYAKLVLMAGDQHVLKQFGREFTEYATNALTDLKGLMDTTQGYQQDKEAKAKSYAAMMAKMKTNLSNAVGSSFDKGLGFGKFASIGIKENRIEFRSVGGNYLNNFDKITAAINRFVVAYAVACDPYAYKNEYGKKLYKLASNVGQGQASKGSMELFARFGAGMLSKDDLIRQLKAQKAEKAEKAAVDQGDPTPPMPTSKREAIKLISDRSGISTMTVNVMWLAGMEQELERFDHNEKQAAKEVYSNLINDTGYYQ